MRIKSIRLFPITLTVKPEFYIVSSAGSHAISRYVVVAIESDSGLIGWGEATVVPIWSGETQGGAAAMIRDLFTPLLVGRTIEYLADVESLAGAMDSSALENHFTKAAVEMALLDLIGKLQKKPVYQLLGGAHNPLAIPIKFSIGLREPDDAANIALGKVRQGFTAIKLKVGPNPEKDLARVRAVREAIGPEIAMNIDVNGGWSVEQSIREIPRYAPFKLAYVEQPTPRWDIDGLARVRAASELPILADEAVFALWQADEVIAKKAADLISIYPGKNGGILKSRQISERAADAGIGCHLGSNLEWDIGTSAMCHLAAACENVRVRQFPVDILGPLYYAARPRIGPIRFEKGAVHVPDAPGLGVDLDPDELEALAQK